MASDRPPRAKTYINDNSNNNDDNEMILLLLLLLLPTTTTTTTTTNHNYMIPADRLPRAKTGPAPIRERGSAPKEGWHSTIFFSSSGKTPTAAA